MRIKILETQSGQRYIVSEKNELAQYRYDFSKGGLQRPQFSGNWRLVGLQKSFRSAISDRISRLKKSWVKT